VSVTHLLNGLEKTFTFRLSVETLEGIQDRDEITVYVYDDPESEKFPEYWDENDATQT